MVEALGTEGQEVIEEAMDVTGGVRLELDLWLHAALNLYVVE